MRDGDIYLVKYKTNFTESEYGVAVSHGDRLYMDLIFEDIRRDSASKELFDVTDSCVDLMKSKFSVTFSEDLIEYLER